MARSSHSVLHCNLVTLFPPADIGRLTSQKEHRRPLVGLTFEETMEFEALEELPPLDGNGNIGWTFEGEPTTPREKRWLELYRKHETAVEAESNGGTTTAGDDNAFGFFGQT